MLAGVAARAAPGCSTALAPIAPTRSTLLEPRHADCASWCRCGDGGLFHFNPPFHHSPSRYPRAPSTHRPCRGVARISTGENQGVSAGSRRRGPRELVGGQPVAKELRTAEQLSDMIVGALGISEVDVRVRKDHAFGWQPTVVSSPGDSIGYQRRVEEIANRLRFHFDLRE